MFINLEFSMNNRQLITVVCFDPVHDIIQIYFTDINLQIEEILSGDLGYLSCTGEHQQFLAHVYRFELGERNEKGETPFELVASKGVIVRALALDLGATLVSLRRVRVGRFEVKDTIPFARLLEMEMKDFPSCVMPVAQALR